MMKLKLISTIRFLIKSVLEKLIIGFQFVESVLNDYVCCWGSDGSDGARVVVVVPHLPDEIVTEILCRLPADKVLECRTVCKLWNALSSTPHFTKKHLEAANASSYPSILIKYQRGYNKQLVYLFSEWGSVTRKSTKRISLKHIDTEITYKNEIGRLRFYNDYGVLNFVLEYCIYLPGSPLPYRSSILYNPLTCQKLVLLTALGYLCAFFHHSVADEYRVIWYRSTSTFVEFRILCLGSSKYQLSWRRLRDFHLAPINNRVVRICNSKSDVLHWACTTTDSTTHCDTFVLMFDVNKEEFSSMPHPGGLCRPASCVHRHTHMLLLELKSGGESSLLCVCDVSTQDQIDMWVLEDYQKQTWVKRHKIVLDLNIYRSEDIYCREKGVIPLGIVNGEMIIHMSRLGVFAYNLSTCTLRRIIKVLGGSIGFQNYGDAVTHGSLLQTSLVSFTDFKGDYSIMEPY